MKKKKLLIGLLIPVLIGVSALCLWQLGRSALRAFTASAAAPTAPARLVTRIDVGVYPVEPDGSRCYTSQSDLTRLLEMLRDIPTDDPAPGTHSPENADFFCSLTLTYSGGGSSICYLLEDRYFRQEDGIWYLAEPQIVEQLHTFLEGHPGSGPEAP